MNAEISMTKVADTFVCRGLTAIVFDIIFAAIQHKLGSVGRVYGPGPFPSVTWRTFWRFL